jgi:hypothetical protein
LIDQNTGITVATGKTDGSGTFSLATGGFVPSNGAHYILEASKGYNAQLPGNKVSRMRTILRWNGSGWLSITNGAVNGQINVHQLATAIAIEVGLGRFPASSAIDTVDTGTPPGLKVGSIGGVPGLEMINLSTMVRAWITNNRDPVEEANDVRPTVSTFSPNSGSPGTLIKLTGTGYDTSPGATTVKFNGTSGTILVMDNSTIYVQVPAGSTSGTITVQTALGTATSASAFSVAAAAAKLAVSGFGSAATANKPLTVFGSGFIPSGNTVTFANLGGGTVNASNFDDQGDGNTFTVTVPNTAASGFFTVANANGTSTKIFLVMTAAGPDIKEVFPNKGAAWGDIQLFGDRFGNNRGTVAVDGSAAQIVSWTDKYLRFKIPHNVRAGNKTVTVTDSLGGQGTAQITVFDGEVAYTSWQRIGTVPQSGVNMIPYFSGKSIYVVGGGGSSNIAKISLNADGGPAGISSTVANLPFGSGGQDMTGDFQNWIGNTVWHFGNNGQNRQKAVLSFDTTTGEYSSVRNETSGSWNTWPDGNDTNFNETGSTTGPKGMYIAGAYGGGAQCRTYYALYDGVNPSTLTGWTGFMQNPSNPGCSADAILLVLNDRLWWLSIYSQAVASLDQSGRPSNWSNTGPPPTNYYFAGFTPIGKYIWTFGKWCGGSEVSRTTIVNGNSPNQNNTTWDRLSNANVSFGGAGNQLLVGSWVYFVGGACGNDNVVHAAPITQ